ncbi:MAG: PspC domain-containing protein [Dehalococcoidia bacterium]
MQKRLYRSRRDRMISGVCGGLAEYLEIDPVIVRIVMVLLALANGIGILAYIIMALVVPSEGSESAKTEDTMRENASEMRGAANKLGEEIRSTFGESDQAESESSESVSRNRRNFIGIILIVIGCLFLAGNFNFFWWFSWHKLWPLIIIVAGIVLLVSALRRRHD